MHDNVANGRIITDDEAWVYDHNVEAFKQSNEFLAPQLNQNRK